MHLLYRHWLVLARGARPRLGRNPANAGRVAMGRVFADRASGGQAVGRSVDRASCRAVRRLGGRAGGQAVGRTVGRTVWRFGGRAVGRAGGWAIALPGGRASGGRAVGSIATKPMHPTQPRDGENGASGKLRRRNAKHPRKSGMDSAQLSCTVLANLGRKRHGSSLTQSACWRALYKRMPPSASGDFLRLRQQIRSLCTWPGMLAALSTT